MPFPELGFKNDIRKNEKDHCEAEAKERQQNLFILEKLVFQKIEENKQQRDDGKR